MDQSLDQLKAKYAPALQKISQLGVKLNHLHVQDRKLFIGAVAPSEDAKNQVWSAIKAVDHSYSDLTADITVDHSMAPAATPAAAASSSERKYTVQAGDTLSAISKHFYGDAKHYIKIYNANRDVISNPDLIKPGQSLKIPA